MEQVEDLTRRALISTAWKVGSSVTAILILMVRSVLLARWLPVEVFGVYALAGSIVSLTGVVAYFGLGQALLHRCPETDDEQRAAEVHLTLNTLLTFGWAVALATGALLVRTRELRTAMLILTATQIAVHLAQTHSSLLVRRVQHGRLAAFAVADAVVTSAVAVGLAWRGATLWALLATDFARAALVVTILCLWRPFWIPRLRWPAREVRYFLRFGARNMVADLLLAAQERLDNLWTAAFLGHTPLGFYSRAFNFASYPRLILAGPTQTVAAGAYAELKGDRKALSQAFFSSNALLVRGGFLLAGLLAVIAPELIRTLLGERWLPMLDAFRLLLLYALLDPIKLTLAHLFVAVGRPGVVVHTRLIQLAVMLVGLFTLGPWLGIAGVSLAVDVMQVVGVAILLARALDHVDFSPVRLLGVPVLALTVGLASSLGVASLMGGSTATWLVGAIKGVLFPLGYGGVLLTFEGRRAWQILLRLLRLGAAAESPAP